MVKLYGSTPCTAQMPGYSPTAIEYCCGAWQWLTGGLVNADHLHRHWWICNGVCLILCSARSNLIPEVTTQDIGMAACPWDNVISCCVCARDCMRYTPGGVISGWTGCVLVAADDSGYVTWGSGGGGSGLWNDTTGQIEPASANCDIVPNGTACVGQTGDTWAVGWFDCVHVTNGATPGCFACAGSNGQIVWTAPPSLWEIPGANLLRPYASDCCVIPNGTAATLGISGTEWKEGWFDCVIVTNGAAAGCFACSNASGQIVWTSPPGGSGLWEAPAAGLIRPVTADCCIVQKGTLATLGTSGCYWSGLYSHFGSFCVPGFGGSTAFAACNNNCAFVTAAICQASGTCWPALCVYGTSYFEGCLISVGGSKDIGTFGTPWRYGYFFCAHALTGICSFGWVCGGTYTSSSDYMYFNSGCLDMTGGDKAAVIEYDKDKYAVLKVDESPDVVFNDHGTVCVFSNKKCKVIFDSIFQCVTEPGTNYNLQLTPARNDWYEVDKQENGFVINSEYNNIFDWHVRKIRKGYKNNRWIKEGNNPFNIKNYKQDEMNTFESYIIQNAWVTQ